MSYKIEKNEIVKLASNKDVYKFGFNYFNMDKCKNLLYYDQDNEKYVSALVDEDFKNYKVKILFNQSGDIKGYTCNCTESSIWRGACKHVVCTLLAIEQESSRINKKIKMKKGAKNIIKAFEKQTFLDIDNSIIKKDIYIDKIRVNPCICLGNKGEVYLKFFIGFKKYYMIKNINEFINNINNKEVYVYGKELTFNHDINMFDKESVKLINFIKKLLKIYNNTPFYKDVNRLLPIEEDDLDKFFDMYYEKNISIDINTLNTKSVTYTKDLPKYMFDINIDTELNIVNVVYKPFKYIYLVGFLYDYIITEELLYRVSKDYTNLLTSLIDTFNDIDSNSIIFENDQYHKFITFVFPMLKKMKMINLSTKELEQINTNIPIVKFYFDYIGDKVTCKILFYYDKEVINPLNNTENTTVRNEKIEYETLQHIKLYGFEDGIKEYFLTDIDKIYNFYLNGLNEIKKLGEVYVEENFTKKNINVSPKTSLGVRINGNLLELIFDTSNYSLDELQEAISSYNLKKKYHRFKDGSFINLQNKEISFMAKMIKTLELDNSSFKDNTIILPKYRAVYIADMSKGLGFEFKKDETFNNLINDFTEYKSLNYEIPHTLEKIMRPYQKIGYNWLKVLNYYGFGGILADDMGLGKTLQIIALLLSEKGNIPSLVITPTSLIYNWQKEIDKFASELKCVVLTGDASKREELFKNEVDADVFVTTYDTLKRDINLYADFKFKFIVADEAQNIKNHLTHSAKAVKSLNSYNRFALTGTPMENSLSELWSIFDFIMPGYLFNHSKFVKTYAYPIVKYNDESKSYELRRQISPFILRRIKSDVLKELPEKVETTIYAEMTKEQKKIYAYNLLKAKGEFEKVINDGNFNKSQIRILANLTRLKQICCHPSLFIDNYNGGSGKLNSTLEYIHEAIRGGHRILLFSQFTSMLSIIKDKLTNDNIKFLYIDGKTSSKERICLVDKFNSGEGEVFLISLRSGGTGLNLTGADIVIHYDQWWNPAVMNQATDRAYRYGQKKTVQVINVVVKDSLEEKILELHYKKRNLTNTVIKEGSKFINNMTKEELIEIFNS